MSWARPGGLLGRLGRVLERLGLIWERPGGVLERLGRVLERLGASSVRLEPENSVQEATFIRCGGEVAPPADPGEAQLSRRRIPTKKTYTEKLPPASECI